MKQIFPTQSMAEFFARGDVKAQQEVQKQNPFGSKAHRDAFNKIRRLAREVGAERFVGKYND